MKSAVSVAQIDQAAACHAVARRAKADAAVSTYCNLPIGRFVPQWRCYPRLQQEFGEKFGLTATFTNTAKSAVNLSKGVSRGGLKVYSCEGEYVLPILTTYFDSYPTADSYAKIPAGGRFEIEEECKVSVDEVSYDKWLEMSGFKQGVFVLKDVDGMWGSKFDIGDYKSGRSFEIEIALVYEAKGPSPQLRDRFGVEGPLFIKDRLVSNTVRIRVRDNNEKDSGRTKGSTRE